MRHSGVLILIGLSIIVAAFIVAKRLPRTVEVSLVGSRLEGSLAGRKEPPRSSAPSVIGIVRVVDGDTLATPDQRIRLYGIDAPESGQVCNIGGQEVYCGREATAVLSDIIAGRSVTCDPRSHDRYGRLVAVCSVDGADLGKSMVGAGWAVAFRRYSTDYVSDEEKASSARLGMWRGTFERPDQWRADRRGK